VKQPRVLQNGSSLLNYAISKLSPEVFSHPIWLRFGKQETSASLKIIDDLRSTIKNLQTNDPSAACQVLLLCAAYQNYAGQHYKAFKTALRAQSLAEQTGLTDEIVWALWGSCAIAIQRGDYEQAANRLLNLQMLLSEQNEWMLADFIDVMKQSLFRSVKVSNDPSDSPRQRQFEDLTTLTLDWLRQWGFVFHVTKSEFSEFGETSSEPDPAQSLFSKKRWKSRWRSLSLAFNGEFNIQWAEKKSHATKKWHSSRRSNLIALFQSMFDREIRTKMKEGADADSQILDVPASAPSEEITSSSVPPHADMPALEIENNDADHIGQTNTFIPVDVYMLGAFNMTFEDMTVKLPASRGLSVLKYLLLNHAKNTPREVLMDVFWPDADPETARNNLNVSIHGLRRSLRSVSDISLIVYQDGAYGLKQDLQVWLDVEEFERCVRAGQQLEARNHLTTAVNEYEAAISLYQGDFLEQNLFDEWTTYDRERLRITHLDTLDRLSKIYFSQERYAQCITVCQFILTHDRCREDAHCLLMRCYSRQGQYHLALRQYQICLETLQSELEVEPMVETTQLYNRVRHRKLV